MNISKCSMMLLVCSFAGLWFPLQLSAQGQCEHGWFPGPKLIEFDVPEAGTAPGLGTQPLANNSECAIVGTYQDANSVYHGFLRSPDGKITSFDAPVAGAAVTAGQGTMAYSINDFGVITGQVEDANNIVHGFVRYPDCHFTIFDAPGAGTGSAEGTYAYNINSWGTISGEYYDSADASHGFVRWIDGHIITFDAPDAVAASGGTYVCEETCINKEGAVTGWYYDASSAVHGYVRWPDGRFTEFDAPGASLLPFYGTIGGSINQDGTVAGYDVDSNNVAHGFVRTRDGVFTNADDPLASTATGEGTGVFSINYFGALAGTYFDVNSAFHGFSRSPSGTFDEIDAPHAGPGELQGTRPSTNNNEGEVVGWYIDGNNLNHGFLWRP